MGSIDSNGAILNELSTMPKLPIFFILCCLSYLPNRWR